MRARRLAPSAEHSLGAIGVLLAVASSVFAYTMIERGERQPGWAPVGETASILEGDPIVTGSIRPAVSARDDRYSPGAAPFAPRSLTAPDERFAAPVEDYEVREVTNGVALVRSSHGYRTARLGTVLPGAGRVEAIVRRQGRWLVVTSEGVIGEGSD